MQAAKITPRKMDFDFDPERVPRWWFLDNPIVTHVSNGIHMLFPEGERFFIRSVKHYLDEIRDDPELVERCRGFFGQESRHGQEHTKSFEMLEAQGFDVRKFLDFYEREAFPWLEKKMPPSVRLSVTVALEHLTATMGESGLESDFLDDAHPTMQALLRWHAAEEIEHKSVAFDVFQRVDGRYAVRIAGMVLGLTGLLLFWRIASRTLIQQESTLSRDDLRRYRAEAKSWRKGHTGKLLSKAFLEYLRPSFHPDQNDNYHLAKRYLTSVGAYMQEA